MAEFPARKRNPDGRDSRCRLCINAYNRARYRLSSPQRRQRRNALAQRPDKRRMKHAYAIQRRYGITIDQYNALYAAQEGLCAICGRPESHSSNGNIRRLSVDHSHVTGQVRGLLCSNCNRALGLFGDTREAIERVLYYLSKPLPFPQEKPPPAVKRARASRQGESGVSRFSTPSRETR